MGVCVSQSLGEGHDTCRAPHGWIQAEVLDSRRGAGSKSQGKDCCWGSALTHLGLAFHHCVKRILDVLDVCKHFRYSEDQPIEEPASKATRA